MRDLLVVIDMQNAYENESGWYVRNLDKIKRNIKRLLSKYEDVLFVRQTLDENATGMWAVHNSKWGELKRNPENVRLMDDFIEYDYCCIEKHTFSAFSSPEYVEYVNKADRLIITGILTECCVFATVFDGMISGIPQIVVTDACSGKVKEREEAALKIMGLMKYHIELKTTDEVMNM